MNVDLEMEEVFLIVEALDALDATGTLGSPERFIVPRIAVKLGNVMAEYLKGLPS